MKKLIVNADDFGLHTLINQGIIRGYREGIITSTSIMPGAPAWEEAAALARLNPGLGIGVHLTLVGGVPPVLPAERAASLLDERGLLLPDYPAFAKRFYTGGVKSAELEAELRAQLERALQAGLNITHIDSHQHLHVLPLLNRLVLKLCNEYNILRMRIPTESCSFSGGFQAGPGRRLGRFGLSMCASGAAAAADSRGIAYPEHFFGMLAGGNLNTALVGRIICALPEGVSELMIHPGLSTEELGRIFPWGYHWRQELDACLDAGNKALLQQRQVGLINFGGLDT